MWTGSSAKSLPDEVNGCGTAYVALDDAFLTGDLARGGDLEVPLPNGPGAPELAEGDGVILISTETPDGITWAVVDHQRGSQLWMLALAFVVALVAFGRLRGVTALVGLGVTFLVLVLFVVPAILGGDPPLLMSPSGPRPSRSPSCTSPTGSPRRPRWRCWARCRPWR